MADPAQATKNWPNQSLVQGPDGEQLRNPGVMGGRIQP